ncbi:MAG TPA: ribonuclease III [Thermotogota bacterium]|nr:ribonuclease III [Thermotogota bacterium]HRW91617.1 ribonuclease III [Thermotogota bacterium]
MDKKKSEKVLRAAQKWELRFSDPELLYRALCHTSFIHERNQGSSEPLEKSNERLEFLGDSVVGLIIVDQLFRDYPDTAEGDLAKAKALLASETILSRVARDIDLGEFLFLGKGEQLSGGRERDSILADAFEALCGAIYLDLGFSAARDFFLPLVSPLMEEVMEGKLWLDFKTQLQEVTQSLFRELPEYYLVEVNGPPHRPEFVFQVFVQGEMLGLGNGRTKKSAEQKAAFSALQKIQSRLEKRNYSSPESGG